MSWFNSLLASKSCFADIFKVKIHLTGRKSNDVEHPDYVPSLFPEENRRSAKPSKLARYERKRKRESIKRVLDANKQRNLGFEVIERQYEQAVDVGTEQTTENAPSEIIHDETLYISPQASEEENKALKKEKETLHEELAELKAADLSLMMENGRLKQEVDSLKTKLQLAEGRALSISTIKEKDGNCRLGLVGVLFKFFLDILRVS